MSSACQCHVEGAFCFYCKVYSPVVAENERLQAEIDRLTAAHRLTTPEDLAEFEAHNPPQSHERMEKLRKDFTEHVRAKRRLPDGTLETAAQGVRIALSLMTAALREIDTHIRATSDPIPHIVATLKRVLPEYAEESGDPFADEEVLADGV